MCQSFSRPPEPILVGRGGGRGRAASNLGATLRTNLGYVVSRIDFVFFVCLRGNAMGLYFVAGSQRFVIYTGTWLRQQQVLGRWPFSVSGGLGENRHTTV